MGPPLVAEPSTLQTIRERAGSGLKYTVKTPKRDNSLHYTHFSLILCCTLISAIFQLLTLPYFPASLKYIKIYSGHSARNFLSHNIFYLGHYTPFYTYNFSPSYTFSNLHIIHLFFIILLVASGSRRVHPMLFTN